MKVFGATEKKEVNFNQPLAVFAGFRANAMEVTWETEALKCPLRPGRWSLSRLLRSQSFFSTSTDAVWAWCPGHR